MGKRAEEKCLDKTRRNQEESDWNSTTSKQGRAHQEQEPEQREWQEQQINTITHINPFNSKQDKHAQFEQNGFLGEAG